MKIALFGCKNTTRIFLDFLSKYVDIDLVVTVPPSIADSNQVVDYFDFNRDAQRLSSEIYTVEAYSLSEKDIEILRDKKIDLVFVIGWQRLLPFEFLSSVNIGCFGMHGSSMGLPRGRGRSPMNWALIEGRRSFTTSLFKYDAGIDSGEVFGSHSFLIGDADDGQTLHFKNLFAMQSLALELIADIEKGKLPLAKQPNLTPSYYPKRSPQDSEVAWEMDVVQIDRFIRALATPFPVAYSFTDDGVKVAIHRACVFSLDAAIHGDSFPGTIIQVFDQKNFLVKCLGGLLLVREWSSDGDWLPREGVCFSTSQNNRVFLNNGYLGFDILDRLEKD